jgi:hypothetical protein
MALLQVTAVASLGDYSAFVESQMTRHRQLWFRGSGKDDYELSPSLYRHPTIVAVKQLIALEADILTRFRQRSLPYLERAVIGDWDYLFLMQHYGVPTRLLDWTENPFVALFFALTTAIRNDSNPATYAHDSAVWVLDPVEWNAAALDHISYEGDVLSTDKEHLKGYAPGAQYDMMNILPVAMYGAHNSRRIVAQRGVFTIFGKNTKPMEKIYESEAAFTGSLYKLLIPAADIPTLLSGLLSIGYVDSVVYPDLDGLSREIKRHFNFRV